MNSMKKYLIIVSIGLILLIGYGVVLMFFISLLFSPKLSYLIYDAFKIVRDTEGYLISDTEIEALVNGVVVMSIITWIFTWVLMFTLSLLLKEVIRGNEQE